MRFAILSLVVASLGASLAACGASSVRGNGTEVIRDPNEPYRDSDDETRLSYGHVASAGVGRAVTELVTRYYAAAAARDGARACALTAPAVVATIPRDYEADLGSEAPTGVESLLRGAKTCTAVLSLLFQRLHQELSAPVVVTGVRVKGNYGYAFVGSQTLPAGFVAVGREAGLWKIDGLLGRRVP